MRIQNNGVPFVQKNYISEKTETEARKKIPVNGISIELSISKEGYESYRRSVEDVSHLARTEKEDNAYKELYSTAVIELTGQTKAEFHAQFKKMNTQMMGDKGECDALGLSGNCLAVYAKMYDDIKQGYADGSREVWVVDPEAENGVRKATEEEELAALDSAFDFYSQVADAYVNHGSKSSKIIQDAVKRLYAELENQRYIQEQREQADDEIENIYEKLHDSVNEWKNKYSLKTGNSSSLLNQIIYDHFM